MKLRLLAAAGFAIAFAEPTFAQEMKTCDGPQDACQELMILGKQYDAAFNKYNAKELAALYTQDAMSVGEGPILSGREAIEKSFADSFKGGSWSKHVVNWDQAHITGNMALAAGSWNVTGPGPNNTTQRYHGNWGNVFVREGSSWKIRMLTWNMIETPSEPVANR